MDILIVGAGPVGLTLAVELWRHGVPCRIIEKEEGLHSESRAAGIHARTLEELSFAGVAETMIEQGAPLKGAMVFSEAKQVAKFDFSELPTKYGMLLGIPQWRTQQALEKRLEELGGRVERGVEYTGGFKGVVIGCDGAHSAVRKEMGVEFDGGDYKEEFFLADCKLAWDKPSDYGIALIDDHGAMFAIPTDRQGGVRIVGVSLDDQLMPGEATFEKVEKAVHHFDPSAVLSDPTWVSNFYLHHRIVTHYREGDRFLLGDAAHIHSPVGGQGMNTGMQDAFNLGWKLAYVAKGWADASLLDTFNEERHPVGTSVVHGVDKATKSLLKGGHFSHKMRDSVVRFLTHVPAIRHKLMEEVSELAVSYHGTSLSIEREERMILAEHDRIGSFDCPEYHMGPRAGDRAPLLDGMGQTKHTCYIFAGLSNHPDLVGLSENLLKYWGHIVDVKVVKSSAAHKAFGAAHPCLYLIRPDGYVAFRSLPAKFEWVDDYLHCNYRSKVSA